MLAEKISLNIKTKIIYFINLSHLALLEFISIYYVNKFKWIMIYICRYSISVILEYFLRTTAHFVYLIHAEVLLTHSYQKRHYIELNVT